MEGADDGDAQVVDGGDGDVDDGYDGNFVDGDDVDDGDAHCIAQGEGEAGWEACGDHRCQLWHRPRGETLTLRCCEKLLTTSDGSGIGSERRLSHLGMSQQAERSQGGQGDSGFNWQLKGRDDFFWG